MINLLPPDQKKKLLAEKKKKMVVIFWFLILFFVVCLILILIAIKIHFNSQLEIQKAIFSNIKDSAKQEKINKYREEIEIINKELQKAESFYNNKVYFLEKMEKISRSLLDEIYLNDLSLVFEPSKTAKSKEEKDRIKVSLQGFAPTREILFDLKDKLEKESSFVNISFPASNWFEKTNINFSVSFEIII